MARRPVPNLAGFADVAALDSGVDLAGVKERKRRWTPPVLTYRKHMYAISRRGGETKMTTAARVAETDLKGVTNAGGGDCGETFALGDVAASADLAESPLRKLLADTNID